MTAGLRAQLQQSLGAAYRLEQELGGGGMSRVFLAEELRLGRKVVVKVLSPDLAQGLSAERFEREILTVAALQQANIVPVLTAGETDGLPFYTMPFVEGESLRAHLARGPLAINDVVGIARDVTKALAYAHQRGVVHRDIKPDNVLLSGGTAVVTDFGIAKAISAARTAGGGGVGSPTLTQHGVSIGTPAYMAPEQAAGDVNVDQRADIYALGAMIYELLSGQPVFAGRTPQRMLVAHMSEAPRPIAEVRVDTPAPLTDVVMRSLAKDPAERPQSASDVLAALDAITSGGSSAAMPALLLGGRGMFAKAVAIYLIAFVVVAIVAKAAIVGIGLPPWVFAGAIVVMALGLPAVLFTGFVQRVTRRALLTTPTYTPGGTPSTTHGTLATMALKAAPHMSWRRTARGGVYALSAFVALIALVMSLRALGVGPFGSLFASGRLAQRDPILLTDFHTTNADTTLGRVVSDAVRAGLTGSSAFTLLSPATIASALVRSTRAPTTPIDLAVARDIAQREGVKAIVDGDVTGVPGGYIVSIRLVRADSGTELASFRETGNGPQGLIDAADKLARALRAKAGESLRAINATPPLSAVTTASLAALRQYGLGVRANAIGDDHSIAYARAAVAADSMFATGWTLLATTLGNYGGTQSAIDSAMTRAYQLRERLPATERDIVVARYFQDGPGRNANRAIAAYQAILDRGDTSGSVMVNLGEILRKRRAFARAESLDIAASRLSNNGVALGNAVELEVDQNELDKADSTLTRLRGLSPDYAARSRTFVLYARGGDKLVRPLADSLLRAGGAARQRAGVLLGMSLALLDGRWRSFWTYHAEAMSGQPSYPDEGIYDLILELSMKGPSPSLMARLDSTVAAVPFSTLPMIDRPYLEAAGALAYAGDTAKARAMVARYHAEVTDSSIVRMQQPQLHHMLGEIALATGKPREALSEFRRSDLDADGKPAIECAPCLSFELARAYDAANKPDSAAMMFERYLTTPFYQRLVSLDLDPVLVPAIRERLGQLYETLGDTAKAVDNDRAFIELRKNADADLQPRVAEARRRLIRLTPVERPRH